MPRLLVIADDLTGGADTGAAWAAAGLETVVHWGRAPFPDSDILVLSTDNRDAPAEQARQRSAAAAEAAATSGVGLVYQKIDSTLRGHPAADALTTMVGIGAGRMLVAPAFPAQGRTTVDGRQLIDGKLLGDSEFSSFSSGDVSLLSSSLYRFYGNGFS